jgi:hypothetical protein
MLKHTWGKNTMFSFQSQKYAVHSVEKLTGLPKKDPSSHL